MGSLNRGIRKELCRVCPLKSNTDILKDLMVTYSDKDAVVLWMSKGLGNLRKGTSKRLHYSLTNLHPDNDCIFVLEKPYLVHNHHFTDGENEVQ